MTHVFFRQDNLEEKYFPIALTRYATFESVPYLSHRIRAGHLPTSQYTITCPTTPNCKPTQGEIATLAHIGGLCRLTQECATLKFTVHVNMISP